MSFDLFVIYLPNNIVKMKESEIVRGNTLIAKFLGWRIDNSFPDKGRVWRSEKSLELDTTLKFHKSWDELMPSIEKLRIMQNYHEMFQWFEINKVHDIKDAWQKVVNDIEKITI